MPQRSEALDKVILMMTSGVSHDAIKAAWSDKLGQDAAGAEQALDEARRAITLAADYNRVEELGTAYHRLNELYSRSLKVQDTKTALSAQKELNRLLGLYDQPPVGPGDQADTAPTSEAQAELDAVARHLLPLKLAGSDFPLREHARIAADEIIRARARPGG